jgi:hypothetical protein
MKKVIIVSQEFPKTQGGVLAGIGSYADTLSKLLISKGIQVIVLTEGKSSSKDKDLEVIGRESSNLWDNLSSPEEYIDQARMFKEWAAERLYQFADRDYIVHIQDSHFGDLARVAKQVGYRNVIITFHHLVLELFFSVAGRQKKEGHFIRRAVSIPTSCGFCFVPICKSMLDKSTFFLSVGQNPEDQSKFRSCLSRISRAQMGRHRYSSIAFNENLAIIGLQWSHTFS